MIRSALINCYFVVWLELSYICLLKDTTAGHGQLLFHDCQEVKDCGYNESGVYHLTLVGTHKLFSVYCDMTTDGSGWLVFQRRKDGSVNFYKDWKDYQYGFGDPTGEYWLGNSVLHHLTRQGHYELRIDPIDWEGYSKFANYRFFRVENSAEKYKLRVSGYRGNAGDSMLYHNGKVFSTKDKDNDERHTTSCAEYYKGGWWYGACHWANLNGLYLEGNHTSYADGVNWLDWRGLHYSLKKTEMKIRRI